ncbi:MAG: tetratricopeptide repeat protein [Butyrivibrio sp.]|nr:tetratricopeptide repeat protein [Acetatifactor muris]MCM1559755.1 tetratricopeptide repeat protein [Butyrivibrio sp.]
MKCSNCGKEIQKGIAFCPECGAKQTPPSPLKIIIPICAVVLCLAAVISAVCYLNSDSYLYKKASEYYEEGSYEKAAELFSRIADYNDSEEMLTETWFFHAGECVNASEYEKALELIKRYEENAVSVDRERADQLALWKEQAAENFRSQGKYEEAIELYRELGNVWATAEIYAEEGNYTQALEITGDLSLSREQIKARKAWQRARSILDAKEGRYEEAWESMKDDADGYEDEWGQAVYETARALADNERYEDATLLIAKIRTHIKEAETLLAECYENQGIACAREGDYKAAWEYFSICDVTEAIQPYLYDTGQFYMNSGAYQEAVLIWKMLKDYRDSESQMKECYRLQGAEYEQEGQYTAALEMYEKYGDAALVQECRYHWAGYAYQTGDYELAVNLYTELGNYADSAEKVFQVQETKQKVEVENEKKTRRGTIDGSWITSNGDLCISADGTNGRSLKFLLPVRNSSVTTINGTFSADVILCKLDKSEFAGADNPDDNIADYYNGSSETTRAINRIYYWDHWDYRDGVLYLRSPNGGWWGYNCTVSGNTMTLEMQEKRFTLTKR